MRSRWTCLIMSLVLLLTAGLTRTVLAADLKPTEGWTLHLDAKRRFPSQPDFVAHHYCKDVSGGLTECQIYDSDRPDAKLVGVEVIVSPETYQTFMRRRSAGGMPTRPRSPKSLRRFPTSHPKRRPRW